VPREARYLAMIIALGGAAGCGGAGVPPHQKEISSNDLGRAWPLTVGSGTLACSDGDRITFTAGGITYLINDLARNGGRDANLMSIWADDPRLPGGKKDIGPLIEQGRTMC
jgi:hypothetical protein